MLSILVYYMDPSLLHFDYPPYYTFQYTITYYQDDQDYDDRKENGILGCGSPIAYIYFLTYIILVTLILINLFLAAVIGGYIESKKENEAVINPL